MEHLYKTGKSTIKPNADCYKYTLLSLCNNKNTITQAENILNTLNLFPDEECYSATINAYATHSSIHNNVNSLNKVYDLLQSMSDVQYKTSSEVVLVKARTAHLLHVAITYGNMHQVQSLRR